jgi:hypothetical protein
VSLPLDTLSLRVPAPSGYIPDSTCSCGYGPMAGTGMGMGGDTQIPVVQPSDGALAPFPSSSLPRDSDILC